MMFRNQLTNSLIYGTDLNMIYMANDGEVSKRRINVLRLNEETFQAYCYLRQTKRTFRYSNILAAIPIVIKERDNI